MSEENKQEMVERKATFDALCKDIDEIAVDAQRREALAHVQQARALLKAAGVPRKPNMAEETLTALLDDAERTLAALLVRKREADAREGRG